MAAEDERERGGSGGGGGGNELERRKQAKAIEAGAGQKLPYPKSIWFIVGNEFCERFSYYGMRAILSIYIKNKLHFNEDATTIIYHTFSLLCYATPLFGAMLADQVLGKFRTILYISMIYVLGHLLKTLAAVPTLGVPPVEFSLIGLVLIALGTGGIKPCVSAFGGDQFKLPEQERQLQTFFSVFYFSINSGALLSTFLTPVLREDVKCFGDDTCYSLAFGVPAFLMLAATILLWVGKSMYVMKPPEGNIITKVSGSIWYAGKQRLTGSGPSRAHWLDHALDKYPKHLVEDVKLLLKVLFIYLPLPVFWALFDQQGSRWTFQATRMSGDVGGWIIKPDQIQLLNPALILLLIPLFDAVIYPFCARFNFMVKPLQRMTVGGLLAAASFLISGFLELELSKTYDRVPKLDESHLHLMNGLSCPLSLRVSNPDGTFSEHADLDLLASTVIYDLRPGQYSLDVRVDEKCESVNSFIKRINLQAQDEKVHGFLIGTNSDKNLEVTELEGFEEPEKFGNGDSRIRAVFDIGSTDNQTLFLRPVGGEPESVIPLETEVFNGNVQESKYLKIPPDSYELYTGQTQIGKIDVGQGGVHNFLVSGDAELGYEPTFSDFKLTPENSVHMFWLFPQYFVMTTGEIIFSVTGLEFSYSQAPESMKSVLQAAWLLTVAFGNLIVIIIAKAKAFDDQASEFFMFAALMFLDMVLFAAMAYFYKYVDVAKREREREEEDDNIKMEDRQGIVNDGYSGNTDF